MCDPRNIERRRYVERREGIMISFVGKSPDQMWTYISDEKKGHPAYDLKIDVYKGQTLLASGKWTIAILGTEM